MAVAPIIVIKQDRSGYIDTFKCCDFGDFLSLNVNVFDCLDKAAIFVIKADFDPLLAENCISIFARGLADPKACEFALVSLELGSNLVKALCLQPILAPLEEIQRFERLLVFISELKRANEVF